MEDSQSRGFGTLSYSSMCSADHGHLGTYVDVGFPKIGGILGGPTIRIIVYWGLCWGPLTLANYPVSQKFVLRGSGLGFSAGAPS